jgi:hypothetical protein
MLKSFHTRRKLVKSKKILPSHEGRVPSASEHILFPPFSPSREGVNPGGNHYQLDETPGKTPKYGKWAFRS